MNSFPYSINKDSSGDNLEPISLDTQQYDEAWLQDLIRQHPGILPTAEIAPVYAPLAPIGREVGTDVGPIDNLFISPQGYPVMVETKLWRNSEARRDVLAQAIDYGASLSKWSYEDLDKTTRAYTHKYEVKELNLAEWLESRFGPVVGGRDYLEETVIKNLQLGRFLTLIVGDNIRPSLIDMISHVNRYPHLAMDVALVKLSCYRMQKDQDWPLVVIPTLIKRTETFERTVVQINVIEKGKFTVEAIQEKGREEGKKKRAFLSEDAYWELLKTRSPKNYQPAKDLIEQYRKVDGITIDTSEKSIVARLDIQDTGEQATLFFIDYEGNLANWPDTIRQQIGRAGISGELDDEYEIAMHKILKLVGKWKCMKPISTVDLLAFNAAAEKFIQTIQSAELVTE